LSAHITACAEKRAQKSLQPPQIASPRMDRVLWWCGI